MAEPRALLAGGRAFALPQGAAEIAARPLRQVPLAAPGLLGLAMVEDVALPVMAAAAGLPGGPAWVLLDGPGGKLVVAGEALLPALPEEAAPLPALRIAARPAPACLSLEAAAPPATPLRAARALPVKLAAELGGLRCVLPIAALEHVVPMPPLEPAGAEHLLGLAKIGGEAVPVLDPAALLGAPAAAEAPSQLVLFRHAGHRLGLPCAQLEPAQPGEATLAARLDALLPSGGAIPSAAAPAPTAPEPMRALLLCLAGAEPFALPVEEVVAAIPPTIPAPAPAGLARGIRGVVAHRGEVLPVLDGGAQLGFDPVLGAPGQAAPMLRLAGPRPVALAVTQVTGLRNVPERLLAPAGRAPFAVTARLGEHEVPVCSAAALAEARA